MILMGLIIGIDSWNKIIIQGMMRAIEKFRMNLYVIIIV